MYHLYSMPLSLYLSNLCSLCLSTYLSACLCLNLSIRSVFCLYAYLLCPIYPVYLFDHLSTFCLSSIYLPTRYAYLCFDMYIVWHISSSPSRGTFSDGHWAALESKVSLIYSQDAVNGPWPCWASWILDIPPIRPPNGLSIYWQDRFRHCVRTPNWTRSEAIFVGAGCSTVANFRHRYFS